MVAAEEVNRSFHFSQDSLTIHSVPIGFTARRLERIDASDSAETECQQMKTMREFCLNHQSESVNLHMEPQASSDPSV